MTARFPVPGDTFEWIDLCEPTPAELEEVAREHGLNPYTVRDCMEPDHLPKFEALTGGINFVIFRRFTSHDDRGSHTIQEMTTKIAVFYHDDLLITIHRKPAAFLQELQAQHMKSGRSESTAEVVVHILWYSLHSYEGLVRELSEEIDQYEKTIFLSNAPEDLECNLYYLKRKAAVTRNVLEQTSDVIAKIPITPANSSSLQNARDLHVKLLSAYSQIREDVVTLLHTHLSLSSQRTNSVMKVLTIFSAFFLPLTFIAGIYGMNFDVMPELRHPYGYFLCLLGMAAVALVIYLWFRRKKWL